MALNNEPNMAENEQPKDLKGWVDYINKKLTPSKKPTTTSLYGLAKGLPPTEEGQKIEQETLEQMEEFGKGPTEYVEGIKKEIKEKPIEAAKGSALGAGTGLVKSAIAGRVGTAVTGAATPFMGPWAIVPGIGAGIATYYGLGKAQEPIEPESMKQLRAEVPLSSATGEFLGAVAEPFVKMPKFTPTPTTPLPTVSGVPALTERPVIQMVKGAEGVYRPQRAFDIFKQKVSERVSSMAGKAYSLPADEVLGLAKDAIQMGAKSFDEFSQLAKVNQLGLPEEVLKKAFTQAVASNVDDMAELAKTRGIYRGIEYLETGDESLKPKKINESNLIKEIMSTSDPQKKDILTKELFLSQQDKKGFKLGSTKDRVRGVELVNRKLAEAVQQGKITPEAESMTRWLLNQNSSLFDDLAFSIKKQNPIQAEQGIAGFFDDTNRLVNVLSDKTSTPIHEITHYMERYMPLEGRLAISDALTKRFNKIKKQYKNDDDVQNYLSLIENKSLDEKNVAEAIKKIVDKFPNKFDEFYQLVSPQEFLAVNGTKIFEERFKSQSDPKFTKEIYDRIIQWIKEFYQKIKDTFGFDSNAPVMRELDRVLKSDATTIKPHPIQIIKPTYPDVITPKPTTVPADVVTPAEPIVSEPPVTPAEVVKPTDTIPPIEPPVEPPIKAKRPSDIMPTWTLGERSKMDVMNLKFGDDAEILGRVNKKVFGDDLPPDNQDMKLAYEQNRQRLSATKENTERTLAQGIYEQATNLGLVNPGTKFNSFENEFNEFLHYNHATARNARNAEILNEKGEPVTTSGSGLTNEEVSEYFGSRLDPQKREAFQSIYDQQLKPILKGELNDLKNAGKINDETFSNLNSYIDQGNYVPLIRDFSDTPDYAKPLVGKGKGKSAKIVASKGSELEVDNPLANILIKSNRAAETLAREETKRTAYRLFVNNPNPEVAVVVDPTSRAETKNRLAAMGLEEKQMEGILDGIYGSDVEYVYINPKTNKPYGKEELAQIKKNDPKLFESLDKEKRLVYEREKLNGYDNVVPVNIDGKNSYIVFNPKAPEGQGQEIADLLNGKTEKAVNNFILKYSALGNNYLSRLYTQYNPAFAVRNILRDAAGSAVQINKTPLVGKYDEVLGNATAAVPTIASESYKMLKFGKLEPNPNNPTSVLFEQFVKDGGFLSYTKLLQDSTETSKSLIDKLNKISKSDTKLGSLTGGSYNPFNWLYESILGPANNVSELSLRFGAYKTALENGFSRDRATQISRDVSLNFSRVGKSIKKTLSPFELFLGPRMAGFKQFSGFATKGGQKLFAELMALGILQQALFDQSGESENEQLNRLSQNGNFVVPTGHDEDGNVTYVKFPLSEIWDIPVETGESLSKLYKIGLDDKQALTTALWNETSNIATKVYTAIPLTPSLDFASIKAGTLGPIPPAFEPFVNALRGKDTFTGLPISPKVYDDRIPGYQRSSIKASLTSMAIAEAINNSEFSKGTRNVAGRFSPTADQIDYIFKGYTGPFYAIPKQIADAYPQNKLTSYVFRNMGKENDWRRLPILNIFLGKATVEKEAEIKYYENLERFNLNLMELGAERNKEQPDMKEYISDYISRNPEAKIADPAKSYSVTNDLKDAVEAVTKSNREIRKIVASEEYRENPDKFQKDIEKLNIKIYENQEKFNRAYQRVIERYGKE